MQHAHRAHTHPSKSYKPCFFTVERRKLRKIDACAAILDFDRTTQRVARCACHLLAGDTRMYMLNLGANAMF